MRLSLLVLLSAILLSSCSKAQNQTIPKLIGGPCEGCEAVFEYGDQKLNFTDTLPDFHEPGIRIKIMGVIYQNDGKTPAENVILYVYHTNQEGVYAPKGDAEGWAKKHGYIRGWLKTDDSGQYAFYTLKPAPYPNGLEAAHIHYTILEPNGKYYWLGSCLFEGDSLLTDRAFNPDLARGGHSEVLNLRQEGNLWIGNRDIVLGKNVPDYE